MFRIVKINRFYSYWWYIACTTVGEKLPKWLKVTSMTCNWMYFCLHIRSKSNDGCWVLHDEWSDNYSNHPGMSIFSWLLLQGKVDIRMKIYYSFLGLHYHNVIRDVMGKLYSIIKTNTLQAKQVPWGILKFSRLPHRGQLRKKKESSLFFSSVGLNLRWFYSSV